MENNFTIFPRKNHGNWEPNTFTIMSTACPVSHDFLLDRAAPSNTFFQLQSIALSDLGGWRTHITESDRIRSVRSTFSVRFPSDQWLQKKEKPCQLAFILWYKRFVLVFIYSWSVG